MLTFAVRRLVLAIPTLFFISFVIFMLLQLAPGDPMAQVPLTVPPEVKEKMRQALGLGEPVLVQYWKWLVQVFWTEPKIFIDWLTRDSLLLGWLPDTQLYQGELRVISWQTRSPVMDIVLQRLPQTLWVVGLAYVVGVLIALPIGIYSAYRQYSVFDQAGTFVTMIGFSIPPFFTGPLLIVIFSVYLGWFPSIYDTTHVVNDWASFKVQIYQMVMPVMVLALQTTAQLSRYMRASMLDNLNQDYVRTARAKGLSEAVVVMVHVLRNSMIPVVTVIALGVPAIFGGAIITENVFKVNGIGQLLLTALFANDLPMVMTLTFIFAMLIVLFNLIADILYGLLDPRIRYD
ncbi:ABC transporter permease [Salipiger marinus]|jgi:peptide/nickel transport system permease protein|uniref:Peptide/nickel transport system permease protein n=1 Tax=Salipiger marinus TaxID=555512 RepID=A0A1G8R7K6_9RHOB|nr:MULTISPECIES: ABC transporter permease [Salipiger]HBM60431.1 ABC transporter permease [Citreicella sp.]MCD1619262.1 ABC transporter permease [Salipiger manganoxidans]MEB3419325.1 ABC transporter permease [Salipiger manganoxidans]SDJ12961.1 peptide/nickel transport system permease protein [Salipiger marinus]HBS98357.1 ABC transporter permease [Citreicella sp.]